MLKSAFHLTQISTLAIRLQAMASASVLVRLEQRAKLAETIIAQLKSQIEKLRQSAAVSISVPEEKRLKEENEKLRKEIDQLKINLTLAQIRNGVRQVPLPVNRTVIQCNGGNNKEQESAKQAQSASKQAKEVKNEKQTEKKQAAKEKPAGQAEPKAKKSKVEDKKQAPAEERLDASRFDFRVGKIVAVQKHADADSLYVEEVDLGEGKNRTVVSGLVKFVPLEEMQNRVAVFMCNLKPAKMRGIQSQAMIMCASTPEKVEILIPPPGSQIGDKVLVKGYTGTPDAQLNPKKKVWETLKPDFRVNVDKVATFKGAPFYIEGKGEVVAPSLSDVQIQ